MYNRGGKISDRDRWVLRFIVSLVWIAMTAGLGYAGEHVAGDRRVMMVIPVGMLWMPITLIFLLIWNPRHRMYW